MKQSKVYSLGIGTTSILMIFIVVCLSILTAFSYVIVNTDNKITNKKIEYNIMYQQADSKAVKIMSDIDGALYQISKKNIKFNDKKAKKILSNIDGIDVDYKENKIVYDVLIKNNNYIGVVLKVNTNKYNKIPKTEKNIIKNNKSKENNQRITIINWKLKNNTEEINDTIENLWMN